jgi:hypothetical protein
MLGVLLPNTNIGIALGLRYEKRKEASPCLNSGGLLHQCTGAAGFYRKISFETRILLRKWLQTLPLSEILKIEGIFLNLLVVNIRKVPIFADPIQKRIPLSIHHHGKSL